MRMFILALLPLAFAQQRLISLNGNGHMSVGQLLARYGLNGNQQVYLAVAEPGKAYESGSLVQGQAFGARPYSFGHLSNVQAAPVQVLNAPVQAVNVHYKSQSAPLNVQHTHIPAPVQETKLSRSEEEPHKIIHEVVRPVIQEVREIIQPYRRIIQEIRPVQEEVISRVSTSSNVARSSGPVAVSGQRLAKQIVRA